MRGSASLWWVGALAAGCTPGDVAWLPFPGDGSAASMILAVERGTDLRLWAVPLVPRPDTIQPAIAFGDEPAALTALLFEETLPELGLQEGLLRPVGQPSRPLRELRFDASYGTALIDGEVGAWIEEENVGGAILEFPLPGDPHGGACPEFDQIVVAQYPRDSMSEGWGTLLVPLDDGGALAGQNDELLQLGPDGTVRDSLMVANLRAGARTSTSIFVIADSLYRAEVDPLRLTEIANLPTELGGTGWISAGPGDQIFSFGVDGSFGFFDGRSWRVLADITDDGGVGTGGALWLGPNEGAVLEPGSEEIIRWDGEVREDVIFDSSLGFSAATLSTTYGAVAIDNFFGDFYRYRENGVWDPVPLHSAAPSVHALTDYAGGLAWGNGFGMVGFSSEGTNCEPVPVLEASEVYEICRLHDGLLVGYQDRNSDYVLIYFRPREK